MRACLAIESVGGGKPALPSIVAASGLSAAQSLTDARGGSKRTLEGSATPPSTRRRAKVESDVLRSSSGFDLVPPARAVAASAAATAASASA